MLSYWCCSNPIPTVDEILKTPWPQYTAIDSVYLDIGYDLVPATGLYKEREDFWHSILPWTIIEDPKIKTLLLSE